MADVHLSEDEAARYLLGELTPAERHEFEGRLAQSAELRALVYELEEGALALCMATPQRRPPPEVWTRIENAVSAVQKPRAAVAAWAVWWRQGWAAAAACLIGWVLYAWWVNHPVKSISVPPTIASEIPSPRETSLPDTRPIPAANGSAKRQIPAQAATAPELSQAKTQELTGLRWQIAELTNRLTYLSQALVRQQGLLAEPDRVKFFQIVPPSASGGGNGAAAPPISTNLQRALLLAMTRELGWPATTSATPAPELAPAETTSEPQNNVSNVSPTNQAGVDFVDLRPGKTSGTPPITERSWSLPGQGAENPAASTSSSTPSLASNNAMPGFFRGTNMVLAVDSSVTPVGSYVTFSALTTWGQTMQFGSTVLGSNPMVVTIPVWSTSSASAGGTFLTVTALTPGGTLTSLGQIQFPVSESP